MISGAINTWIKKKLIEQVSKGGRRLNGERRGGGGALWKQHSTFEYKMYAISESVYTVNVGS